MDLDDKNICKICYDEMVDNVELKCGHSFCYSCIIESYKKNYLDFACRNNYNKTFIRECPYCRNDGGYLNVKCPEIPLKGIHKEYKTFIDSIKKGDKNYYLNFFDKSRCLAILKTGDNKGKQCNTKVCGSSEFCGRHKKII